MRFLITLTILFSSFLLQAQNMDNQKLYELIEQKADTIEGFQGRWQFIYKEMPMLCVTDATNNRMRIIAPVTPIDKLDKELLLDALTANFHSALDVKYAISGDILWSIYVHPLQELTPQQVNDAVVQVYSAAATFGTTFSSTELLFGGNSVTKSDEKKPTILKKEQKLLQKF